MSALRTSVVDPVVATALVAVLSVLSWPVAGQAVEHELRITLVDADSGRILPGRIAIADRFGQRHQVEADEAEGTAVPYNKQNWINADAIEVHTTISGHRCRARLPEGQVIVLAEHGKAYLPARRELMLTGDEEIRIELRRWFDPAASGWYSGDTHLHRTVDDLKNILLAEDLNVALPLTHWVTIAGQPPSSGDKNSADADQSQLIKVDEQHVIWPRNTEYEIFSVAGKRHTLGALFVLGHETELELGVPPWQPVITSLASRQPQALLDMDKLDWPFAMLLPTLAPHALYELSNNHTWQTRFAFRDWNSAAPAYLRPPFGGKQGGHRQWLDYTQGMYHTLLNCGLRMPPSAGTASGVHPVPAGFGRVYVHLPDGFSYEGWMRAVRAGRSFVTTGPMLLATADGHDPGHVWQHDSDDGKKTIELSIAATATEPVLYAEVIVSGQPRHLLTPQNERTAAGAYGNRWTQRVSLDRSGWFAVRVWQQSSDGQVRFAHSAPWYIEVDALPVKPARYEREYLVQRMQAEIARCNGLLDGTAMQELRSGLEFYRSLPVAEDTADVQRTARPAASQSELDRWLDNMIVDHRFTADEVRLATGLSIEQAQEEVRRRTPAHSDAMPSGLRLRPYPGGRHPRRGFLDGAIDPQRETKVSVFAPWAEGGYVVIDVPEAIFSNLGLIYLAHTHVPTIWDKQSIDLPRLEWSQADGNPQRLKMMRRLPNGISFHSSVEQIADGAQMAIELTNATDQMLTGLRVQVCTMLKGAEGFNLQEPLETIIDGPTIAIRAPQTDRWIITRWTPNHRVWRNPPVPCIHADPIFADCPPGQSVVVRGTLRFYEGRDPGSIIQALNP